MVLLPFGSPPAPDASATKKGKLKLAGDLGGTADSPTVPSLSSKANDADVVHDTGNETIAGVKTFSSDPIIPDEAYGAGWDGSLEPPTKNAVYDKIQTIGGGGGMWTHVANGSFTGTGHQAISSLDGNTDKIYLLKIYAYFGATNFGGYDLGFNTDIGTGNYISQNQYGFATTNTSTQGNNTATLQVNTGTGAASIVYIEAQIFAETGRQRIVSGFTKGFRTGGGTYQFTGDFMGIWKDTTTNITAINLRNVGGVSATTAYYKLYKSAN